MRCRLLDALAHTTLAAPRPLCDLELPARACHLLSADKLENLRQAAVLVPIIERPHGLQVMLTLRTDTLRRHAGQISFPGGSREAGDADLIATALRESHEEIGLVPQEVEIIGFLDDYPTITGFRITPIVGLVRQGAQVAPDGIEVARIFEVPLPYLAKDESYERGQLVRKGMKVPYYAVTHDGYRIWGATAGMLRDLQLKLNN